MEILNLDELAKDQAYEFLFVLGPLLLRGGIGVPINPIAIRVAGDGGGAPSWPLRPPPSAGPSP